MADGVRLELDSDAALDALRRALEVTTNPRPMLASIGEGLLASTEDRFRDERAPDGTPWAPLSPSYRRVKRKNANRILWLEGRLGGFLRYQLESAAVLVGSDQATAVWHQFGTRPYTITPKSGKALSCPGGPGPRKKVSHPGLPARPFLGVSSDDEEMIVEEAMETLRQALS